MNNLNDSRQDIIPEIGDVYELTVADEEEVIFENIDTTNNNDDIFDEETVRLLESLNHHTTHLITPNHNNNTIDHQRNNIENNHNDSNDNNDDNNNNNIGYQRQGTISSARYNLLSTMVGGGCLSLPLAFIKSGNILIGPIILIIIACITEFVFRIHIQSSRIYHKNNSSSTTTINPLDYQHLLHTGTDSFEKIAAIAFGSSAYNFCMILVTSMCFFGTVGYAVLLRDMLQPINDAFIKHNRTHDTGSDSVKWNDNICMWIIVIAITPACTLQTLTALQRFGALSMCAIFIVGCCVVYRSIECLTLHPHHRFFYHYVQLYPNNMKDILDVLPLYISCYVCHYNILPVHNELQQPTQRRVTYWLKSTVWASTLFYCIIGIAGSVYGICSKGGTSTNDNDEPRKNTPYYNGPNNVVHGNVLLDFPEDDPLLFIGRMCLAITITLAFPILIIPARDIMIRTTSTLYIVKNLKSYFNKTNVNNDHQPIQHTNLNGNSTLTEALLENDMMSGINDDDRIVPPSNLGTESATVSTQEIVHSNDGFLSNLNIISNDDVSGNNTNNSQRINWMEDNTEPTTTTDVLPVVSIEAVSSSSSTLLERLFFAIIVFWSATALASCVSSIDIVWNLLGSSLSILLSYLIPCSCYVVICNQQKQQQQENGVEHRENNRNLDFHWSSKVFAFILVLVFTPLMLISTANAVYNTFFSVK